VEIYQYRVNPYSECGKAMPSAAAPDTVPLPVLLLPEESLSVQGRLMRMCLAMVAQVALIGVVAGYPANKAPECA
jgi:hypothetical protein